MRPGATIRLLFLESLLLPLGHYGQPHIWVPSPSHWPVRAFEPGAEDQSTLPGITEPSYMEQISYIIWVKYAHNTLPCSSSGLSPFQCAYGYQPPLFPVLEEEVSVPSAQALNCRCRRVRTGERQILLRSSARSKRAADLLRIAAPSYRPG